ncbi:MAG: Z1 domain-containing protein [Desulfuromonadaceae bacterium]
MAEYESEIAYFRITISKAPQVTLDLIRSVVDKNPFMLPDEAREEIIRYLEHTFDITQKIGSSLKSCDYKPWLAERRGDIDFYYWNRLKRYYIEQGVLPPNVLATLDLVTDEILDYSGNPDVSGDWDRRGMVLGHVQSGKTTNYSALICKAADAGYKIIILLAGITNSLRRQTQERLDETFIGRKSLFQASVIEPMSIVNYAEKKRFPAYGTSRDRDFKKEAARTYGVTLAALKEPIIFVTKKNKTSLENLRDWLKEQNSLTNIEDTLILIDDEADNASINTLSDSNRVTAINGIIREILALFDRSTYVGYTATPFANIFIDPDTEDEMLKDDLYPRHFIKALEPPTNYVGATRVFREGGDLRDAMVRTVADYEDILPLKHKNGHPVVCLPPSLEKALKVFILTRAIRVLRGDGDRHCSMMINVSRFNSVQDRIHGLIYLCLDRLKNAITVNAGLGADAVKDRDIAELRDVFLEEYAECGFTFDEILNVLSKAAGNIAVRTVNMRGSALDYAGNTSTGLHIIAIGGLALSRGLTLEGLTVSYILRNASASDTLMQMARWFGYRNGYEDICRLYLPESSCDHYEFITEAIEELRSEIVRMERLGMTPEDFGLRVRHNPAAIRITAANKMRSATKLYLAQDYSGRHVEGYVLYNDDLINRENLQLVRDLIADLGQVSELEEKTRIWRGVNGGKIYSLLSAFRFPEVHNDLGLIENTSLFQDYVADRLNADLKEWDVALLLPAKKGTLSTEVLPGEELSIRTHGSGVIYKGHYKVTPKNSLANPGDELTGLSESEIDAAKAEIEAGNRTRGRCVYSLQRKSPMLLIHVFYGGMKNPEENGLRQILDPVVSLSFCMPGTTVRPQERCYQVTKVFMSQFADMNEDGGDDESVLDGGIDD